MENDNKQQTAMSRIISYRSVIAVAVIMGVVAVVAALGLYPVVRVNDTWVLQRDVQRRVQATASVFRHQGMEEAFTERGGEEHIRRVVLEGIIIDTLLRQVADEHVDDLDDRIAVRLNEVRDQQEKGFAQAVKEAYGISVTTFEDQVLAPAAVVDIVREQVDDIEQTIANRRSDAAVEMYFLPYEWNGTEVIPAS